MSEPAVQPAPKKGMSTGIKILLGCLLGLLLLGLGTCAACYWGAKKLGKGLQDYSEKLKNDPDGAAYDAALFAFKMNPEVEIVSQDENTKSITVRNKKDGKEVTFNLEDIKSGRLSIESEGEKVNFGVQQGENGQGGTLTVESDKGKMVLGGGDGSLVPDWIPSYPGARTDSFSNLEANGEKSGTFTLHTSDPADQVIAYFEDKLKSAGYEVQKTTINATGAVGGNLNATLDKRTLNLTVATQEGETQGLIAYTEKP